MGRGARRGRAPVGEVADRLYAVPPEEFIAARGQEVAAAREAGDHELAAALGRLRRPTVAAWAVNLLVRHEPQLVDELVEVGTRLRDLGGPDAGDVMRALDRDRRRVVAALVHRAGRHAAESGHVLSAQVRDDVSTTLLAAMSDPEVAARVREGRLTKSLPYAGFGPAQAPSVPLPRKRTAAPRARDDDRRQAARRDLEEAERLLTRSRSDITAAETATAEADAVRGEARERVRLLREQVTDAERRLAEAELDHRARQRELGRAHTAAEKAEREVRRRRSRLR